MPLPELMPSQAVPQVGQDCLGDGCLKVQNRGPHHHYKNPPKKRAFTWRFRFGDGVQA